MKSLAPDMLEQVVETARRYQGRLESGHNRGEWVDELNARLKAPLGSPWCATFACGCVLEVQNRFGIPPLIVPQFHVKTLWNENKAARREHPEPGFIVVWSYPGTINGHCGIVTEVDPKIEWFDTVEGNSDNEETDVREGGGAFPHKRFMDDRGTRWRRLGFLKTF